MTKRLLAAAVLAALVVSACSGSAGDGTSTLPPPSASTTAPPPAVLLSYQLEDGDLFQYEVALDQHLELTATGDQQLTGGDDLPGEAVLDIAGTATFTQEVAAGADPGTYEIHITGEFADLTVTGTVDGEPVDSGEVPDFAPVEPIDITVVVDEQGNPLGGGDAIEDPFAGLFGDAGALGSGGLAPGIDPGQFVGPPLPEEEVTVGDSWTEEVKTPGFGEDPIVTTLTSTVTSVEQLDGFEVFVIETTAGTEPVEIDLAQFFAGFFGAFTPGDTTDEQAAELQEMMDQLVFLIGLDDARSEAKTWFDPSAGLARRSETTGAASISMDMTLPDETTGELVSFSMKMTIDQTLDYRLVSAPEA